MLYAYSMRIAYQVKDICDYVGATTAKCQIALFGRWCDLTVTAYCLGENPFDATAVAMSYGIRPLPQKELLCSCFDGCDDGVLMMSRGTGGNRQDFGQKVDFPLITGEFFDRHTVADGGVPAARNVIRGALRGTESMVETIRQSIRECFPEHCRELALATLDDRYGQRTVRTLNKFLSELHWRLMLAKSGCDDAQLGCIEAMAAANPPRFYDINFDGPSDIPLVGGFSVDVVGGMRGVINMARQARQQAEAEERRRERDRKYAEASDRATKLLAQICGKKSAEQFKDCGFVTIEQDGYRFEIPANAFVRCTDPTGKHADLCIHTSGFQCNPIDEIIIAWLHIKHKLAAYMAEAVVHGHDRGFQRVPKVA